MKKIKIYKFLLELFILFLISGSIWKIYDYKNELQTREYQYLTELNPQEIIFYQKKFPQSWQDFIAILSVKHSIPKNNTEHPGIENILNQLESGIDFSSINWTGIRKEDKKKILYYHKILKKYQLYNPDIYTFPTNIPCYYEDTYGAKREGGKRSHQGVDLFNKKGTEIISVCDGFIEKLGWNRLGGERVGVRGKDGNYYYYAHLDQINENLYIGKEVKKGERLGTMGNTGDAITTPAHLHFGILLTNDSWINPYSFLKVWECYKFNN